MEPPLFSKGNDLLSSSPEKEFFCHHWVCGLNINRDFRFRFTFHHWLIWVSFSKRASFIATNKTNILPNKDSPYYDITPVYTILLYNMLNFFSMFTDRSYCQVHITYSKYSNVIIHIGIRIQNLLPPIFKQIFTLHFELCYKKSSCFYVWYIYFINIHYP